MLLESESNSYFYASSNLLVGEIHILKHTKKSVCCKADIHFPSGIGGNIQH